MGHNTFLNIAKSGNQLTLEGPREKDSSKGKQSFLNKFFARRKENATLNTQFKVASDTLTRQTYKLVHYDPFLDELLAPEVDPLARFKR